MKTSLILVTLTLVISSVFGEVQKPSAAPEIATLRKNYEDSLNRILIQYIREGNIAAASEVSLELDRISLNSPTVEIGNAPIGAWKWAGNNTTIMNSNGMTTNGKNKGIWRWLSMSKGEIEIKWANGYIDTLTISPDGKTLHGVNNQGTKFSASFLDSESQ